MLFLRSLRIFGDPPTPSSHATILWSGLLVVLSTLAKASYAICLLPGLALYCLIRHTRGKAVEWRLGLTEFLVPLVLVLAFQYVLNLGQARALSIEIAPFYFFRGILQQLGKPALLLPKLAFSVLFPVSVLLVYFREGIRSIPLMLSWTIFGFGAFYTYFVVESGPAGLDGNFTWSGQISLYVLFVMSLTFFLERGGFQGLTRRSVIGSSTFGLHVVSGLIWAYHQTDRQASAWW
jgi:hypothetical protein